MNTYRNIDREKIQFDFVVNSEDRGFYDDEIERLGGRIYRITPMSKNLIKHMIELKRILTNNKYNTIHRHTCTSVIVFDLLIAKMCKIKNRIVHSHSNNISSNYLINSICKPFLNSLANIKLACSVDAAKWLFGKKYLQAIIINNGINIEEYKYSENNRKKIRKELMIDDNITVIGHVGSFSTAKNHKFIIDIFNSYLSQNINSILILCGDGIFKKEIEKKVKSLNIEGKVIFLGIRKDVNIVYSAFDIFIFPSLYEGLGIALIEAQISGLKCIVSNNIQSECILTDNVKKLSVSDNEVVWANEIINYKTNSRNINLNSSNIKEFNINETIKKLEDIYE